MSQAETHTFQAEVAQVLDIVINSLYTDREIFLRELISNSSDALEKMRVKTMTEKSVHQPDSELKIEVVVDKDAGTITLTDTGIGMNKDELQENLGTIAKSGTKAFLNALKEKGEGNEAVIGQFGVGFYSAFMVADKVVVTSRNWEPDGQAWQWSSDGSGSYTIESAEKEDRGSQIVLHLKEDQKEFLETYKIKGLIERYSNFISFPLSLDGEQTNTVQALWRKSKGEVSDEEYTEFYKFIGHATDEPRYTMHFSADAPLAINSLLFVPGENQERFGMGPQPAGVSLYCRQVLIDDNPEGLLPEWLRFLKGVIDSEDLPLNISRESMQDSSLVKKLNSVITKRFLKFLEREAKKSPDDYKEFYTRFSRFLKEGVATSYEHKESLAGLLRFASTATEGEEVTDFQSYIDRAAEDQESIYYLVGTSRDAIEAGPYLEAFAEKGIEVLLFTDPIDEYVLDSLMEVKGKKLVAANRGGLDLGNVEAKEGSLSEDEATKFSEWFTSVIGDSVSKVSPSHRLTSSPAAALLPEDAPSPQVRAMMEQMGQSLPEMKASLEINPSHELVTGLDKLRDTDPATAELVARQMADSALLAAGLIDDPAALLRRNQEILEALVAAKG